jgi:transcriptional regulator with XRE-family HTH domain
MWDYCAMATNTRKPNAVSQAIAAQLRAERAAAGLTREQVYEAAGVSRSTYARIEKGSIVIDTAQLAAIAAVLGVPASDIWRRAEDRMLASLDINDAERVALDKAVARRRGEATLPNADRSETGS